MDQFALFAAGAAEFGQERRHLTKYASERFADLADLGFALRPTSLAFERVSQPLKPGQKLLVLERHVYGNGSIGAAECEIRRERRKQLVVRRSRAQQFEFHFSDLTHLLQSPKALDFVPHDWIAAVYTTQGADDAVRASLDADGARAIHDESLSVEGRTINGAQASVFEDVANRLECSGILEHRRRKAEEPYPGSAVEVIPSPSHVDGAVQMSVPGDDEIDAGSHGFRDLAESPIAVRDLESFVVRQPVHQSAPQGL